VAEAEPGAHRASRHTECSQPAWVYEGVTPLEQFSPKRQVAQARIGAIEPAGFPSQLAPEESNRRLANQIRTPTHTAEDKLPACDSTRPEVTFPPQNNPVVLANDVAAAKR